MSTTTRHQRLTPRAEQRILDLLSAARDVFAERGFERATTLEIAQRAGVSEPTVFTYFDSKRDLCVEVIRRWYGQITADIERDLPLFSGLPARLRFIVRRHLDNLMGEGVGICALVLSEGRTADKTVTDVIAELKRAYVEPLMRSLRDAVAQGEIRDDMPLRLLRDMVFGSMEHVLWGYVVSGVKPDIEVTSRQLTEMLCAAFAPASVPEQALRELRADVSLALRRCEQKLSHNHRD
ncbi:MAG TPA: TetR/AcrR family transcriptional regulator [Burkholderiaceae bacterium]